MTKGRRNEFGEKEEKPKVIKKKTPINDIIRAKPNESRKKKGITDNDLLLMGLIKSNGSWYFPSPGKTKHLHIGFEPNNSGINFIRYTSRREDRSEDVTTGDVFRKTQDKRGSTSSALPVTRLNELMQTSLKALEDGQQNGLDIVQELLKKFGHRI